MNVIVPKNTHYVIGLMGAIGTGKSLVRKMLEHKGALTIDADYLAHSAYKKGTKGYLEIVSLFGKEILDSDGQINRNRLSELVFMDSGALAELERIIHPLVVLAVKRLIDLSSLPIIVVEAIKLLESDLKDHCDTIWAVTSPQEEIYKRLMDSRGMERSQVDGRLKQQSIRHDQGSEVDIIIPNQGTIKDLWMEVSARWDDLSGSSRSFSTCQRKTLNLMQLFRKYLIQPDNELQEQSVAEIKKIGLPFLPVNQLTLINQPISDMDCVLSNWEIASYKYYLWKSEISSEDSLYLVSDMENFTVYASISAREFNSDAFMRIMGLVQEFSRLHLCENLFFPFNRESKPFGVRLGYRKNYSKFLPVPDMDPQGYSLLCKKLRKSLNLFNEN
jgi:dephospho-CoA kinase